MDETKAVVRKRKCLQTPLDKIKTCLFGPVRCHDTLFGSVQNRSGYINPDPVIPASNETNGMIAPSATGIEKQRFRPELQIRENSIQRLQ